MVVRILMLPQSGICNRSISNFLVTAIFFYVSYILLLNNSQFLIKNPIKKNRMECPEEGPTEPY